MKIRLGDSAKRVREIEMILEGIIHDSHLPPAVGMQFFTDFRLYGMDEAIIYLLGYMGGKTVENAVKVEPLKVIADELRFATA
jgi:hypothetical protein